MSLTKFLIERTGENFYYDNKTNGMLDNNQNRLSKPFVPDENWEVLKDQFGKITKSNKPETIKITLGHGCNYSCGYCLQKDIGNPNERPVNGLTYTLKQSINRHLDMTDVTRFELWGGETLLYWKDMVEIMDEFDREGITWYIPTNGTPLMNKHVDYFMQMKGDVTIGISHDGPAHESTRGKEFLHKKIDVLRRIQDECYPKIQFSFNPVISKTNYDLFAINDFFKKFLDNNNLKPVMLAFEIGRVYDKNMAENSTHHVISGDDINKYKNILHRYLAECHQQFIVGGGSLLANTLYHAGSGVLPFARSLKEEKQPLLKSSCGADDERLISMDMLGNVRTCQNVDDSYVGGNLMNIKGIRVQKVNFDREDFCGTCPVKLLCHSSCPLELGEAVFHTNHAIEYIHYSEIQQAAFSILFNSNIQQV